MPGSAELAAGVVPAPDGTKAKQALPAKHDKPDEHHKDAKRPRPAAAAAACPTAPAKKAKVVPFTPEEEEAGELVFWEASSRPSLDDSPDQGGRHAASWYRAQLPELVAALPGRTETELKDKTHDWAMEYFAGSQSQAWDCELAGVENIPQDIFWPYQGLHKPWPDNDAKESSSGALTDFARFMIARNE